MLDLRLMHVLRAVVTCGSVTAAAGCLGYTPSAVSQQVAALEKQAGIALLERVGRGVRPTAAGRLLTEHTAIIGKYVAEAETALADLRDGHTGRLVIRYFPTAGPALMPPALARMHHTHPAVHLDLMPLEPQAALAEVERGDADVAIIVQPPERTRDGVRLVHLRDDPYRVALPRGHLLAGKRMLSLGELADEPWVGGEGPSCPCRGIVLDACAAAGFSPDFTVQSDDYATAQGFVAAGLGVSLIPQLGLTTRHPDVVVRKVRAPEPFRPIYAAVRETLLGQPALDTLLDGLRCGSHAHHPAANGPT